MTSQQSIGWVGSKTWLSLFQILYHFTSRKLARKTSPQEGVALCGLQTDTLRSIMLDVVVAAREFGLAGISGSPRRSPKQIAEGLCIFLVGSQLHTHTSLAPFAGEGCTWQVMLFYSDLSGHFWLPFASAYWRGFSPISSSQNMPASAGCSSSYFLHQSKHSK